MISFIYITLSKNKKDEKPTHFVALQLPPRLDRSSLQQAFG